MILGGGSMTVVTAPDTTVQVVVPIAGPQGPKGDPGDGTGLDEIDARLAALEDQPRGHSTTVSAPTLLVQIQHGLPFRPAGVQCIDTSGDTVEHDGVTHPLPGITEVTFGAPFTGAINLS